MGVYFIVFPWEHWGSIGIMEYKMETTLEFWGYMGV